MEKNYYNKFFDYLPDSCGYKSYTKELGLIIKLILTIYRNIKF